MKLPYSNKSESSQSISLSDLCSIRLHVSREVSEQKKVHLNVSLHSSLYTCLCNT